MINDNLHRQPMALDHIAHRGMTLRLPVTDWSVASRLNALFVAAAEFAEVCREFPIVFVKVKEPDGSDAVAPLALFGMLQQQNLYVDVASGRWRAQYVPALLRAYPFCIARMEDGARFAVCIDGSYAGVNAADGQALFEADGQSTPLLKDMTAHLEHVEAETQRTRMVGKRLLDLGLLQDMRFDATLPDGRRHSVDGFLTVDDKKVTALADDVVCELHRNGILGLVHAHWVSLGNMRRLLDWHVERSSTATAPTQGPAAADAATADADAGTSLTQ